MKLLITTTLLLAFISCNADVITKRGVLNIDQCAPNSTVIVDGETLVNNSGEPIRTNEAGALSYTISYIPGKKVKVQVGWSRQVINMDLGVWMDCKRVDNEYF